MTRNRNIWLQLLMVGIMLMVMTNCNRDKNITSPTITTTIDWNSLLTNNPSVGGIVSNDGGANVTERGICWSSTNQNPSLADNILTHPQTGIGAFSIVLSGLSNSTDYFVSAYASNSAGTSYGNVISFTTYPYTPRLSTNVVTNITQTSAQCGGNIVDEGISAITARGVCWSTHPNPTIADNKTIDGTGIGSFSSIITGLVPSTIYYVRAYATNSEGTNYGYTIPFGTNGTVTDADGNVYQTVVIGEQIWMAENLKTTKYSNGTNIPNVDIPTAWNSLSTGAYCDYDNNLNNSDTYGRLYNWFAVTNPGGLAPAGWRIPSNEDWGQLINYLEGPVGDIGPGCKLKESGVVHWVGNNQAVTNETGFTALPGGMRAIGSGSPAYFDRIGLLGSWWTTTEYTSDLNRAITISMGPHCDVNIGAGLKGSGSSIRCIKN